MTTKQKKISENWSKQICKLNEIAEAALSDLDEFEECGITVKVEDSEESLRGQLHKIKSLAFKLHETLISNPIRTAFSKDRISLSEQDYWLLRAQGLKLFTAKRVGISPVSDYEVYKNCIYEDEEKVCFLDPDETSEVETVDKKTGHIKIRFRISRSPEELELKHLRPEQKEFFAKYRPDVLARLKKNQI